MAALLGGFLLKMSEKAETGWVTVSISENLVLL